MNKHALRHFFQIAALAIPLALVPVHGVEAAVLDRRPYIMSVREDGAVIVWRTLTNSTGEVRYGTTPGQLTSVAPSSGSKRQHEVTLAGLTAGTRYYYEVVSDGQVAETGIGLNFETAPPLGERRKFRAWVVGDSGNFSPAQFAVRDAMVEATGRTPPDLYLHVGDMAYGDGEDLEFTANFYGVYADILAHTPIWPAIGNHEGHSADSATQTGPYYEGYVLPKSGESGGLATGTEAYYAWDWGNVHFIVLDSYDSDRSTDGPMLTWLADDLAATNAEWIVAFWHHPPYTKGSHDSDDEGELIDMRENALPILEAAGVDLVLAGHSHIYERSFLLDGAYQTPSTTSGIVDGGSGKVLDDGPYTKPAGNTSHNGAVYVVAGHGGAGISGSADHPLMYFSEKLHGSCLIDI
jgi:hypothetical protein